jgi:hypothetical protein
LPHAAGVLGGRCGKFLMWEWGISDEGWGESD